MIVNTKSADQIQIISPHDKGISSAIQANSKKGLKIPDNFSVDLQVDLTQKLREEYFKYLKDLLKIRCVVVLNMPFGCFNGSSTGAVGFPTVLSS